MGGQRRSYTREFKIEAARLVREGGHGMAQVARDLGVPDSVLWRWVKQYAEDPEQAFPGKGHLKVRDEELRRLQCENENLRQEREILKKALAIFSKGPR